MTCLRLSWQERQYGKRQQIINELLATAPPPLLRPGETLEGSYPTPAEIMRFANLQYRYRKEREARQKIIDRLLRDAQRANPKGGSR